MTALYDRVRELPLRVEGYELEPHELYVRPEFTRKTTVVRLLGAGEEGLGEDVTYDGELQDAQQERGPTLPLAGDWTIESFSRHLETQPLFPEPPERHDYLDYRRWAFEIGEPRFTLSLRPEKRIGNDEVWDRAEGALRDALEASDVLFTEVEGEGAFYGPKIDLFMDDVLGWMRAIEIVS